MSEWDLAVRAARAELERDLAVQRTDDLRETVHRLMADKPLTLFGKAPEYWLELERAAIVLLARLDLRDVRFEEQQARLAAVLNMEGDPAAFRKEGVDR